MALQPSQQRLSKYDRVYSDDDDTSLSLDGNFQLSHQNLSHRNLCRINLWKYSTFFFQLTTVICMILIVKTYSRKSYESGFSTEVEAAYLNSDVLSMQPIRFHSPFIFNSKGTKNTYRTKYVADPSPEIDAVWDELTKDRYFWVTEDEAKQVLPTSYKQYYHNYAEEGNPNATGYMFGIDVLHTLHCVNRLRKALSPEYYFPHMNNIYPFNAHNYHCIDHIRQMVMCYSDLTPIPNKWYDDVNAGAIDSDQVHMCRNFDAIRTWANGRDSIITG